MTTTAAKKRATGRPAINNYTKMLVRRLYSEGQWTCKQIALACNISTASLYRIMNEEDEHE